MLPDLLPVRTPEVIFYVLRDADGLYLIDAGFMGGRGCLRRALRRRGWEKEPIRGIIVTHGHLDHILNVGRLAQETGAWIAAPRLDADHYAGHPHYRGWAHVTGLLEGMGRPLLSFRPFVPDRWLDEGDFIDVWHGLRAVHLPGHTAGQMGFLCERLKVMFTADLFASYFGRAYLPPAIFNSVPKQIQASVAKASALPLDGVLPNHCDRAAPAVHLQGLQRLNQKLCLRL